MQVSGLGAFFGAGFTDSGKEDKHVGKINTYNQLKGFGFIRRDRGKDVFFFFEDFLNGNANIVIGDTVEFTITKKEKGPRAYNIEVVSGID